MPEISQLFKSPRCQHVHYSGKPCKAPARRGRNYCVFHQAAHLDPGGCVLPVVEDLHSYQVAVIRIMQSLAADAIDSRKATALLYALQLLGGKLNDFAKQREEVENPTAALKKEILARYDARTNPVPSWVPEKDLVAILREMRAEQPTEPNENSDIIPQPDWNIGVPPVTQPPAPCAMPPAPSSDCHSERGQAGAAGESESRDLHCSQPRSGTPAHPRAMGPAPDSSIPPGRLSPQPNACTGHPEQGAA